MYEKVDEIRAKKLLKGRGYSKEHAKELAPQVVEAVSQIQESMAPLMVQIYSNFLAKGMVSATAVKKTKEATLPLLEGWFLEWLEKQIVDHLVDELEAGFRSKGDEE